MSTPTLDDARAALRARFGFDDFRPHQAEAVAAVLTGRDVVATMPTGAGKSLLYQLPDLCLDGLTLVVSPLIALMKDQVDALRARGIAAAYVNSSVEAPERARRLEAARRGELDLLYVTPERFRSPAFRALEAELPVTRLAVDEAHCISQWGHDFRPDYSRLGRYRARLAGHRPGPLPTIALTATATPRVTRDIVAALDLDDPLVVRTGIERPNLFLGFHQVHLAEEKVPHLAARIRRLGGPGIVYSTLIRDLEDLHDELARAGIPSLVYHGRLSARERRAMQERFMASSAEDPAVVLATNAFGMGVDKADIRFVLHAQVPRTIEAWTQEVGRAGRDGAPSFCETLFFGEDLAVQQEFVRWANPDRDFVLGVLDTLARWGERVATKTHEDLVAELLVKNRRDNRAAISLRWLEVLGAVTGSFETHDLAVDPDFDPADLPAVVGSAEKLDGDLRGLLAMAELAGPDLSAGCRRVGLAAHFELDEPGEPCGTCDLCLAPEAWLDGRWPTAAAPAPAVAAATPAAPDDFPFARGDWVRYGRRMGRIVQVAERGRRLEVTIEDASSLSRRTIDPRKVPLERLE